MPDQGLRPTKYVSEPSPLLCPVCKNVFSEPIISVKCGHTFCRSCIEDLIRSGLTCPLDSQTCDSGQLVLNRAIMGQLADLQIYCCHGLRPVQSGHPIKPGRPAGQDYEQDPDGCPEVIMIGGREKHEDNCSYALVECPVGQGQCGLLRRLKLEEHMATCNRVPCPFTDFGMRVDPRPT
jgi:E3 ubiquitin-protein ligase TRAF7